MQWVPRHEVQHHLQSHLHQEDHHKRTCRPTHPEVGHLLHQQVLLPLFIQHPKVHINWSHKDSKPNKAWLKLRCRIRLRQMILYVSKGQSSYHRWQPMLIETLPISWHWNLQVTADNDTLPNAETFSTPAKGGRNESEDFNGVVVRTKN